MALLHSVDRVVWCSGLQDSFMAIDFVPLPRRWWIHLSPLPDLAAINRGNRIFQIKLDQTSPPK